MLDILGMSRKTLKDQSLIILDQTLPVYILPTQLFSLALMQLQREPCMMSTGMFMQIRYCQMFRKTYKSAFIHVSDIKNEIIINYRSFGYDLLQVTYPEFHYTSLLYLTDHGLDFKGGEFIFVDEKLNRYSKISQLYFSIATIKFFI